MPVRDEEDECVPKEQTNGEVLCNRRPLSMCRPHNGEDDDRCKETDDGEWAEDQGKDLKPKVLSLSFNMSVFTDWYNSHRLSLIVIHNPISHARLIP